MELTSILAGVAFGSVTTGGVAALLIRLIEKRVTKRMDLLHERDRISVEIMKALVKKALDASEVLPITMGRTMRYSREVASQWPSIGSDLTTALGKSVDEFETELYRYYGVVRPDVYDKLHCYKSTVRDLLAQLRNVPVLQGPGRNRAPESQELQSLKNQMEEEREEALITFRGWVSTLQPFRHYYDQAFA